MRRVFFVHNGPLYRDADGQVYGTHLTETVKERYLLLGDHVTFLMREVRVDRESDGLSAISPHRFRFVATLFPYTTLFRDRKSVV